MSFKLNVTTNTQTQGSTQKRDVDWNALNLHVIEAAGTDKKARSVPGIISGIYDLGEQERPDAEITFTGDEEEERKLITEKPLTYFKDGIDPMSKKSVRLMCYPQKPVQQVAITVDFPQVLVDKGQFFGNSKELPLRMLLNGEFNLSDGTRVVGRPYSIVEKKYDDGVWAFAKNNGLHKLAEACELLDDKGYFKKDRIGELLGKTAQFQFRVYMKPSAKDKNKKFFTEEIKLSGIVPEGVPVPEAPEGVLHGVNLFGDNDVDAVKQLRLSVRNTIRRANNYPDSDIAKLLEISGEVKKEAPKQEAPKAKEPEPIYDSFDDDIPFAPIGLQEGKFFLHMI